MYYWNALSAFIRVSMEIKFYNQRSEATSLSSSSNATQAEDTVLHAFKFHLEKSPLKSWHFSEEFSQGVIWAQLCGTQVSASLRKKIARLLENEKVYQWIANGTGAENDKKDCLAGVKRKQDKQINGVREQNRQVMTEEPMQ